MEYLHHLLPPVGGTFAYEIDELFETISLLMGIAFVISLTIIFILILMGRRTPGVKAKYLTGETKNELVPIYLTLATFVFFDMVIDVKTHHVWATVKESLPASQVTVKAVAQQWAWTFINPGADGELGTADDISNVNELHLPAGQLTHVELESSDVLHSFSIPVIRIKQDAIPGRIITIWFESMPFGEMKAIKDEMNRKAGDNGALLGADTPATASFDLQCTEMCGVGHGIMSAKVIFHSAEDYANWQAANAPIAE
jgi:cytochrome c oxidase subunit 2